MAEQRRNLKFRDNEKGRTAYEFLSLCSHNQSEFVAELICNFLNNSGIKDVSTLNTSDAKELIKKSNFRFKDNEEGRIAEKFLSLCGDRQSEFIANLICNFLREREIVDVSSLTQKDVDDLISNSEAKYDNLFNKMLHYLKENGYLLNTAEKNTDVPILLKDEEKAPAVNVITENISLRETEDIIDDVKDEEVVEDEEIEEEEYGEDGNDDGLDSLEMDNLLKAIDAFTSME